VLDLLHQGYTLAMGGADPGFLAIGAASVTRQRIGTRLLGLYDNIRQPGSIYRRHHLNQRAVFETQIPGNSVSIQLTQAEHDRVHAGMRDFYKSYIGMPDTPSVNEYNRAQIAALTRAGVSRAEIGKAMRAARAEQQRYGLSGLSKVKRVPTR